MSLGRRVAALELAQPTTLPLSVKAWLGELLTGAERAWLATERPQVGGNRHALPADCLRWLEERGA